MVRPRVPWAFHNWAISFEPPATTSWVSPRRVEPRPSRCDYPDRRTASQRGLPFYRLVGATLTYAEVARRAVIARRVVSATLGRREGQRRAAQSNQLSSPGGGEGRAALASSSA